MPILCRSHGYLDLKLPGYDRVGARFQLALERYSVQHADFVLAASAERVGYYRAAFGVEPSKIGDLPYGISMPEPPSIRTSASQDEKPVTILYVGRVELRKGCDILFDALRIVHESLPSLRVLFVGPVADDMSQAFTAFLEETRLWVHALGSVPQEEVAGYLRQGDMIVLPSRFETLPRVLIEALAAGVPQIGSSANGIPEIVDDGVTGFVIDPIAPEAFADAIFRLVSSPELRARMSERSRERALAKFEIDSVMNRQVKVYRALASGEPPLKVLAG
jgi:glycosyltransferase involved in cell wall biosynthesis